MKEIIFEDVSKQYGSVVALHPTRLSVNAGEFLTLLGPSGSGKTTLLNTVAGHLESSGGRVLVGGVDFTDMPARKRNIGMVFQNYALFPHLSVFENVAYGLRVRRVSKSELRSRVEAVLDLVQLRSLADRAIQNLSGGQQQRVALARAIVIEPSVLLLDEPMGALDRQLRKQLQLELRALHRRLGYTTLYVTHDQEEALVLSDRIAVFRAGRLEQIGTASQLYHEPANRFVAQFLGESNLPAGKIRSLTQWQATLSSPDIGMDIVGKAIGGIAVGQDSYALIRPESVLLDGQGDVVLDGTVTESLFLGEMASLRVRLPSGFELWSRQANQKDHPVGSSVKVGWLQTEVCIICKEAA